MKAVPDSSICNPLAKGRHVGPAVGYAGRRWAGHSNLGDVLRPEYFLDDAGDCAASYGMCARILRVHRRIVEWLPSCLAICIGSGINIAVANCRDSRPKVGRGLGGEYSDI